MNGPEGMPLLVTGASGFVGGWLAGFLHARGYPVRALYRRERTPAHVEALALQGAQVERGDLTEPADVRRAVRGTRGIIHAASLTSDWGPPEAFRRANVEPTLMLLEEARREGCDTFLYISTVAVHGFGPHLESTEEGPYYPLAYPYQLSKKEAEECVRAANGPALRTICIRPGNVYGPRDTTTFYPLLSAVRRGVRGTLGGGRSLTCPVYVTDLCEAVYLALRSAQSAGEVLNITGAERVSWGELMGYAASLLGARPWLSLPIGAARLAAKLLVWLYRAAGASSAPPLTPYRVEQLAHDYHFSIAKAQAMLGYVPAVGWREGLRRTVAAYRQDVLEGRRPGRRRRTEARRG